MKEEFLYYLWKFRKFNTEELKTLEGEIISIINPGVRNENSGPDFFNARLQIGKQLWAGNVEMHIKSSDWYLHGHETDSNYENVILHVVWEHDAEIFRKNRTVIPTLELKSIVDASILDQYTELLERDHLKLNCEQDFAEFSDFQVEHWLERLYFERLEKKSLLIEEILNKTGNDWEATCFIFICRSFGLNINGEIFSALAQSFRFHILRKQGQDQFKLEALLLGQAKLIKGEDKYALDLQKKHDFLKTKYKLKNEHLKAPEFFRLRPDNFPTIRLAQIAALYAQNSSLFQKLMETISLKEIRVIFKVQVSEYWKSHYNFSSSHIAKNKNLSSAFIDLLIINCIIPLKFVFAKHQGVEIQQQLLELVGNIKKEKNSTVQLFNELRPGTAKNALQSQALIELKKNYCDRNNCLHCELGASLFNKSRKYV